MKNFTALIIFSLFALNFTGCLKKDSSDDSSSSGDCTMVAQMVLDLSGEDLSTDFNVVNVPANMTIISSTCLGVVPGSEAEVFQSAVRTGNILVLTDSEGDGFSFAISGTNLPESTISASFGGCTITETTSGALDNTGDTITVDVTDVMSNACLGMTGLSKLQSETGETLFLK